MEKQIRSRDIKIVAIGNSKGIRIPKVLIQKYGFSNSLLIEETDKGLLYVKRMRKNCLGKKHTKRWLLWKKNGMDISVEPLIERSMCDYNKKWMGYVNRIYILII